MWYDVVEKNEFLQKLYISIPDLINVRILNIQLCEGGSRAKVSLLLPVLVDNPPLKWKQLGYDTAIINLDLFAVSSTSLEYKSNNFAGNIYIKRTSHDKIIFKCEGNIDLEIYAEVVIIQEIRGGRLKELQQGI